MDLIYKFSSNQYAQMLNISTEALRSRRRREIFQNYKQDKFGNYWWKDDRPNKGAVNEFNRSPKRNGLFRNPGAKKIDTLKRNRGSVANGTAKEYPNWKMKINNEVKTLTRITNTKYGDIDGEEIVKEIGPEMIDMAVDKIRKRKEAKNNEDITKTEDHAHFKPYDDQVPPEYGRLIKGTAYADILQNEHSRSLRQFKHETDSKVYRKTKSDSFGQTYEVNRMDFQEPRRSNTDYYQGRPPPYYVGDWTDPGSVEVSNYSIDSIPDDREPTFKNKIEEDIWRLKNKKY
jgi:hypothetical protein